MVKLQLQSDFKSAKQLLSDALMKLTITNQGGSVSENFGLVIFIKVTSNEGIITANTN
ncbi:MAG: hypothetical protein AAGK05_03980 [Pseudomonadota bacterium]